MNGGMIFCAELLMLLPFPLQSAYLHASRYQNAMTGGKLDWKVEPSHCMDNRSVLIIDDILDEGHTLAEIVDYCSKAGAREVVTAVLINKKHERKIWAEHKCDFIGLQCEDHYAFGYGMDYKGYWRNAPGIYRVTES